VSKESSPHRYKTVSRDCEAVMSLKQPLNLKRVFKFVFNG
jgi:hypothetical protein